MKQYHELIHTILQYGVEKKDRTGVGTMSVFGYQTRYSLKDSFPLVTTKKVHMKSVIHELLWFLRGDTNVKYLKDNGVTIWDEWADESGELGPVYGKQWCSWLCPDGKTVNQIEKVIEQIKKTPDSRRLIVSAWNVADIDSMKLPPCHTLFQFFVHNGVLTCQLYQRSADVFLGVPFNIASYALLTMMIAQVCGLQAGELVHTFGDAHLYSNHMDQVKELMAREIKPSPVMKLNKEVKDIFGFKFEDFTLEGYQPHPAIKAPIAV